MFGRVAPHFKPAHGCGWCLQAVLDLQGALQRAKARGVHGQVIDANRQSENGMPELAIVRHPG